MEKQTSRPVRRFTPGDSPLSVESHVQMDDKGHLHISTGEGQVELMPRELQQLLDFLWRQSEHPAIMDALSRLPDQLEQGLDMITFYRLLLEILLPLQPQAVQARLIEILDDHEI